MRAKLETTAEKNAEEGSHSCLHPVFKKRKNAENPTKKTCYAGYHDFILKLSVILSFLRPKGVASLGNFCRGIRPGFCNPDPTNSDQNMPLSMSLFRADLQNSYLFSDPYK